MVALIFPCQMLIAFSQPNPAMADNHDEAQRDTGQGVDGMR